MDERNENFDSHKYNENELQGGKVLSDAVVLTDDSVLSTSVIEDIEDDDRTIETKKCDLENKKFTITHEDVTSDEEPTKNDIDEFDSLDQFCSVGLLRGTVSELDRALRDSRALIKTRDEEIVKLRREIEHSREHNHKEQLKWERKSAQAEERKKQIEELKRKLNSSEKTNEELAERIKEYESPFSESDGVPLCCSSMKELMEVKMELAEKELLLQEIKRNNQPDDVAGKMAVKSETRWEDLEQHNELKLKFLRDAFFYFMIDFHSEEQMNAILAVLCYGDQREDVIKQAFRMRQRGKKFTVKEVSSRELSFLHEEI